MSILENFQLKAPAQQYNYIERQFAGWDIKHTHTMPMSFRKLFQAQLSANTVTETYPLGDNRSRHVMAFMAGTVGAAFTAVARILRISIYTLFLLPAVLVRFGIANRYGIKGVIAELFKKYSEEFIDAGVTLLSVPVGLAKTINPKAFSDRVTSIAHYYMERAERRKQFAQKEERAIADYERLEEQAKTLQRAI